MSITVQWLIENRVMLVHFSGEIDSEQILAYLDESLAMRDKANEVNGVNGPLVHTISDGTKVTKQAVDLGTIRKIMKSLRQQRVGWSFYVSENRMDRFVSSLAHQFGGIRYQSFATMAEAIQFLLDNDRDLREQIDENLETLLEKMQNSFS